MITRPVVQAAFDLMEFLQGRGFTCVIAGGFARDVFFGAPPKDIDIIIVNSSMGDITVALGETGVPFIPFHLYLDGAPSDRIVGGFKMAGGDIDVILYDVETPEQAVDAFDYNLNQFVVAGAHRGIDEATVRFVGKDNWGELKAVREDASPARQGRVIDKFLDLRPRRDPAVTPNEAPIGGTDGPF